MRVGERIRRRRRALDLTQRELSERSLVNQVTISIIERTRDENTIYLATARKLAYSLGMSLDQLVDGDPDPDLIGDIQI